MTKRITILGAVLMLLFLLLFVQLNNVQVKQANALAHNPQNPALAGQKFQNCEGNIDAADGTVLAQSVPTNAGPGNYQCYRSYPHGALYEQVVGYSSIVYGTTGVESHYKSYLVTHNKPVKTLGDLLSTHQVQGTVTLTIQPKIQEAAQQALKAAEAIKQGAFGSVVALDPSTGAVLAMYSDPSFNPNPIASLDGSQEQIGAIYKNRHTVPGIPIENGNNLATDELFPPGSTFKIVTTSAAYQYAPQLLAKQYPFIQCIPPSAAAGQPPPPPNLYIAGLGQQLCNFGTPPGSCGGTIAQMIPPSCDTGFALVGNDLGFQNLYNEASAFGFFSDPPIDLPSSEVVASTTASADPKSPFYRGTQGEQAYVAYDAMGQNDSNASPLQMALVAAAVANNGQEMTPYVVSHIYDSQGNRVYQAQPSVWKTPISAPSAQAISGLMQQVVSNTSGPFQGTASGVGFNPADHVAAKTGTSQAGNGNTDEWMIAFAPANAPKIAVAVCVPYIPTPSGAIGDNIQGATFAGPVVNAVIQAALGQ